MNNLEKIKKNIVTQIRNMSIYDFRQLLDILEEQTIAGALKLDISGTFTCAECKEKYGICKDCDSSDVCERRFVEYAMENVSEREEKIC